MSPVQLPDEDQSTTGSTSSPWKRRKSYPVHSVTSDTASQRPATPPPEKDPALTHLHDDARSSHPDEPEQDVRSSPQSVAWSHKDYPMQLPTAGSTTGPVSPPLSDDEPHPERHPKSRPEFEFDSGSISKSHGDQPQQADQAAKESKSWNRHASYPLQVAASNANLRSSPTPPQSSTEKDTETEPEPVPVSESSREQPHEVKQSAKGTKTPTRRPYPLQSPASHHDLLQSSTPPSSYAEEPIPEAKTELERERESKLTRDDDPDYGHDHNQNAPHTRVFRRQRYPAQVQAGSQTLKQQEPPRKKPGPESEMEHEPSSAAGTSANQSRESEQPATTTPAFSRQSYPLVALASDATAESAKDKQLSNSTPSKSKETEDDEVPMEQVNQKSSKAEEKKSEDVGEKGASSHAYPIQPPIEVSAAHVEFTDDEKPSELKPQEKKIAAKVVEHWRRGSYPLQSPNNMMPFQRSTTPQPQEDEAEKIRQKPKKIHLPKNLRAMKDSEELVSGRTIVILLDGTGDKFDDDNSNIVHLVSALKKDDPHQVTYYQAGIGTYSDGGLSTGFAAAADMAVGSGLGLHVRDAYHFLMHSYKEGDKVCIFGFSRGAYTARCLAGMIHKVGLLPPRNIQQIYFAYEFYANDTEMGWKQSEDFKKTFCIDVSVHLLGCFDSVASVGFIPRQLPLSSTPTSKPRYFRHAMALDERRAKFKICRHQTRNWEDITAKGSKPQTTSTRKQILQAATGNSLPRHKNQADEPPPGYHKPRRFSTFYHPNVTDEEYRELKGDDEAFETDVLEVWFAGAHADVGGGAVPNSERHKLAQIPLRWMIRQCFECNTGIIFKTKILAEHGLDVHTLWPKYERLKEPKHGVPPSILEKYETDLPPRSTRRDKLVPIDKHHDGEQLLHLQSHNDDDWTPELVEDFYDALCKINDQLIDAPTWWILELLPVEIKIPVAPGDVRSRTGPNLGRYRGVDDVEPNVHWTVLHRARQMGYKIQARTAPHTIWKTCV